MPQILKSGCVSQFSDRLFPSVDVFNTVPTKHPETPDAVWGRQSPVKSARNPFAVFERSGKGRKFILLPIRSPITLSGSGETAHNFALSQFDERQYASYFPIFSHFDGHFVARRIFFVVDRLSILRFSLGKHRKIVLSA